MKITFLGTGTSQGIPVIACECETCESLNPKDKRWRTSCLISLEEKNILIDVGPDFRQQMLINNSPEIHAILLTHEHNDHVGGLDDIRPYNFKYEKDMPLFALSRVADSVRKRYDYIFQETPYPGVPQAILTDIDEHTMFEIEGISVTAIPVMHGQLPILGYKIANFAYLTDVKTLPDTAFSKLENLDVLVLSALRHEDHHSHLTVEEAISLAQKIKAKKTYFTHFSHLAGTHHQIEALLPEGIFAAYDGLVVDV